MLILIGLIVLLIIIALNIPLALRAQKKFLSTCEGEYKTFQDANLKKFIILFFVILIIAIGFAIQQKKYLFLLAAALMLFLVVGAVKNAMIVTKDKLYFRECAVPLTEIKFAELTYTNKGKYMILFHMQNDHKFGYAHGKLDSPKAIADAIQKVGIPVEDNLHKKSNTDSEPKSNKE